MATGILNSCVYGVVSILPMEYINAVILGNNLSGCFTAAMSIISKLSNRLENHLFFHKIIII